MGMIRYCPRCGHIYSNDEECSFCGERYVITKYTNIEFLNDICNIKQKILEDYVKKSPEFDEELFNKREAKENAVAHGIGTPMSTQQNTITCPYCHSTNVSKIGILGRAASVGIFGLASKKIGKQWHCNHCKSDF